jgi:hypothetical protein
MPGLDSQTSTILLLIVLGYLIYTMCTPNQNDNFQNTATVKKVQFNIPPKQDSNTLQDMVNAAVRPQGAVLPQTLPTNMQPTNAPSNPSKCQKDIGGFDSSIDISIGAELEPAFGNGSNVQMKPDCSSLNINKQNMINYNAIDFLPVDTNPDWFNTDFTNIVNEDTLINTDKYVIGINTVGQSLKNASYDIRGTIPNPKFSVSPWNNSTYEPDMNLKSLC